jgi:preprotein translocase subunit SecA
LTVDLPSVWRNRLHREETICLALAALHLFHRDAHYVVRRGKVLIIDETTSRAAPGRVWSRGLHQLIEMKETCRPTPDQQTAARITYQRFFTRYLRLGGMSGTLAESRIELASMSGLKFFRVPLRLPSQRKELPTRVFTSAEQQWQAVVQRVRELHEHGRPVLIGTDSVADSEKLAAHLRAAGLSHCVLNARQDAAEAEIVALAGQRSAITVATNMAGRGTDIVLGEGVIERGGLHVICCQHNSSRRVDRQFRGRCARRGEPGSTETMLSLESPLIAAALPRWLIRRWARGHEVRPRWLAVAVANYAQRREESRQRAQRWQLLKQDMLLNRKLSFGGPAE